MLHQLNGTPAARSTHRFADVPVTGNLRQAVSWMAERGITTGRGTTNHFDPGGTVTRGQVSALLFRLTA